MHLYSKTIQTASAISHAVFGNFSAPKAQEIICGRGKILELLRPDDQTGRVQSVLSWEVFGVIRCVMPFRLTGGNRDYIVVGSDSGRINILQYNPDTNRFDKIHEETFGKSGCRRIVPGQYIASDPKGRAVMIGAIEKQKLVYILNRDASSKLVISSSLEAHKSQTLCLAMCGVDVEFDNPVFACIEIDYSDAEDDEMKQGYEPGRKLLTFYELDLGLNHVSRKSTEEVDPGANLLMTVPGGDDGPGGVIVLAENWVIYMNEEHEAIRSPIPRRTSPVEDENILIVSYATHKQKDLFFFLIQSELGDIYKVTLEYEGEDVNEVHVKYFDTVPPTNAMCVLKIGFLFCASEFSNHYLFTFKGIGDDSDDAPEASSQSTDHVYFSPRRLRNLMLVDEVQSLSPVIDLKVLDLAHEDTPQIYTLCGRGPRSNLRILRHGLAVTEMAVSEVPGNPNAVWSVKKDIQDEYDSYIIVSFLNATLVLSIGDTVEEVSDSGFLTDTPTLNVSLLGDNTLLQVHPDGIRLIHSDKRIQEWKPPGKKKISHSTVNRGQVIIALSPGELAYFELNHYGELVEIERKDISTDITCLAIAPIPAGREKARFMAVGCGDRTVRVLDLDENDVMRQLSTQLLNHDPNHLLITPMEAESGAHDKLFLYAGLSNGVLVRSVVDPADGSLSDSRRRFLGRRPVKLFALTIQDKPACIALSTRSWLSYYYQGRYQTTPLSYEMIEYASHFSSEQCQEGVVSITGRTLRIITLERLGGVFNQTSHPLRYTPRAFEVHDITNYLIIIEADHNAYPYVEKRQIIDTLKIGEESKEDSESAEVSEAFVGAPKPGPGKWGSCVRVMDPVSGNTVSILELEDNEAAVCMCLGVFKNRPDEIMLVVGTSKDLTLNPRSFGAGFIHVYRFINNHAQLQLLHKTQISDIPLSVCMFQSQLLVGVGKILRLYDLGKKKLLRKSECRNIPQCIRKIKTEHNRIYVGDMVESFHLLKYNKKDKSMKIFADNVTPRYITAMELIDYNSIAGGDKFGNFHITRYTPQAEETAVQVPYGGLLNGASEKMSDIINFHVGETVTAIQKTRLRGKEGAEVIVYGTVMGAIGCFIPFTNREEVDFFSNLEMHMRQMASPLCGRDHLAYRSYYFPVKETVDGDLCEQFSALEKKIQKHIADELECKPSEVQKRLEEIQNRVL